MSAITEKALEYEPRRRYSNAGEMAEDLQRYLDGGAVKARPVSPGGRLLRLASAYRGYGRALLGGIAVVLVLLAALVLVERQRAERETLQRLRSIVAEHSAAENELRAAFAELEAIETETTPLDSFESRKSLYRAQRRVADCQVRGRTLEYAVLLDLQRALERRPSNRGIRALTREFLLDRYLIAERSGLRDDMLRYGAVIRRQLPEATGFLKPRGTLSVGIDLPDAELRLFQYVVDGPLLRPLPVHPARPLGGLDALSEPGIVVRRPPPPVLARCGLRIEDKILKVNDRRVGLSGNRALLAVQGPPTLNSFDIVRAGDRLTLSIPARLFDDGAVEEQSPVDIAAAVNEISDADAFILDSERGFAWRAADVRALSLPPGNYLAVLRAPGYEEARHPFTLERDQRLELAIRMFRSHEVPVGYVHIPAGPAELGGDPDGFYPTPARTVSLPDYFIQRGETTLAEYLEFLNDPVIRSEISAANGSHPLMPSEMHGERIRPICEIGSDGVIRARSPEDASWAARFVSRVSVDRYVEWKNGRAEKNESPWRFALVSTEEFEKAGRGTDGRLFPWGNGFEWSLACTHRSSSSQYERRFPFATDASPYDVRDLAGGVAEMTRSDAAPPGADPTASSGRNSDCRVKGGSGFDDLKTFFHLAGETRERKDTRNYRLGFRLVAYPEARESQPTARR